MPEPITDDQLSEWRAAERGASAGPWEVEGVHVVSDRANIAVGCDGGTVGDEAFCNLAFIALSRTALPALLEEVERLQGAIREMVLRADEYDPARCLTGRGIRHIAAKHGVGETVGEEERLRALLREIKANIDANGPDRPDLYARLVEAVG